MTHLRVSGGTVYDPANNIDGEIRDLWINTRTGRVVDPPSETDPSATSTKILDATGYVIMPGGVDMHSHITGSKVNAARKLRPEDRRDDDPVRRREGYRSGTVGSVPSTFSTGYLYAGLGYTTVFDAAVPPLSARHAHEELADTPAIDKGFYTLVGNNRYILQQIQAGEPQRLAAYLAWLLTVTRAYAPKIVNPGGVEVWKTNGGTASGFDEPLPPFGVTPRQIVTQITRAANEIDLPHPIHIHCNNLGLPGNSATTHETMKSLDGLRGHLTHIQFHSYAGDPDDQSTIRSAVPELVEFVNTHPNLTVDVGQVMFGETTSMTGDGPLGHFLHRVTGRKWVSADVELEAGCGIVPITYRDKSLVHSLQWAIGLEWYLLTDDPWRIGMSTDHPNGAAFTAYPEIIALLMDRSLRADYLARLPDGLRDRSSLADLDREYTLSEIAIITRAAPARMLGLDRKGHLGPGADGDLTIYRDDPDRRLMFEVPRWVIRRGEIIIDDGELRGDPIGETQFVTPAFDRSYLPHIREWFEDHSTISFANFGVGE